MKIPSQQLKPKKIYYSFPGKSAQLIFIVLLIAGGLFSLKILA